MGKWTTVEDYPVGCKVRGVGPPHMYGTLYHVRGHVDGCLVVRCWNYGKQLWEHRVFEPWQIEQWARVDDRAGRVK